jgi:hypothetical protein
MVNLVFKTNNIVDSPYNGTLYSGTPITEVNFGPNIHKSPFLLSV